MTILRSNWKRLSEFTFAIIEMLQLTWQLVPRLLLGVIIVTFLMGLEPIASAWITKRIFDIISSSVSQGGNILHILFLIGVKFIVDILYRFFDSLESFFSFQINERISLGTKSLVFEKIGSLKGLKFFEDPKFYNVIQMSFRGAHAGPSQSINIFTSILRALVVLVSFAGVLFNLDSVLASVVFVTSFPLLWVRIRLAKRRVKVADINSDEERRRNYYERILHEPAFAKEVKLFNLSDFFIKAYQKSFLKIFSREKEQKKRELTAEVILSLGSYFINSIALSIVLFRVLNGVLTVGDTALYLQALNSVQGGLQGFVFGFSSLTSSVLFFKYYQELLQLQESLQTSKNTVSVSPLLKEISLKNVSFRYSADQPWILKDCDLTILKGEVLGVVGLNGAGKTTLAKLLLRFYSPTEGMILWDGIDIREFDILEYREHVSTVFQDFVRYDLNLRENIGVGDISKINDLNAIQEAAQRLDMLNFVPDLPAGFETDLSYWISGNKKSTNLSGGQWQKIANARSLMKIVDFVILDEPTSSLDVEAEQEMFTQFKNLVDDKTALLISHRFSTLSMADKIAVLQDGKVIEYGTHENLIMTNGYYYKMYNVQIRHR